MINSVETVDDVVAMLPDHWHDRILTHFDKACCKHPRFADTASSHEPWLSKSILKIARERIAEDDRVGRLSVQQLVDCEFLESLTAKTDDERIDELYDTVAVLMRYISVLEGKTRFGR